MKGLFGKYSVVLAPMAGITDVVFRQLCSEQGADLAFTEMVSAKGLSFANDKTRHLLSAGRSEKAVAVQLFGHEPHIMARQAQWIEDLLGDKLALIDINMGCPARKIVKKGDGAALMKDPDLAASIVSSIKASVSCPVTAKFRRGYHEGKDTSSEFARSIELAGADAVTVHGRYATQMYRGESSNECIARVKQSVSIPVVGNGDVKDVSSARKMIDETGCDAIMIARAALGNPWVFKKIKDGLEASSETKADDGEKEANKAHSSVGDGRGDSGYASINDRIEMMLRHSRMLDRDPGLDIKKMRKLAPFYIKGIDGASKARAALSRCSTYVDFEQVAHALSDRIHCD